MAKAKSTQPIPPFPPDIDRTAFGHWLSGFADGEACFVLDATPNNSHRLPTPYARFFIKLRADDVDVLHLIQSYWQCGYVTVRQRPNLDATRSGTKPTAIFDTGQAATLAQVIVPHFTRFPLWAKKRNDFDIWKQAVNLLFTTQQRPRQRRADPKTGRAAGTLPRWTDEERSRFQALAAELIQTRRYAEPAAAD